MRNLSLISVNIYKVLLAGALLECLKEKNFLQ